MSLPLAIDLSLRQLVLQRGECSLGRGKCLSGGELPRELPCGGCGRLGRLFQAFPGEQGLGEFGESGGQCRVDTRQVGGSLGEGRCHLGGLLLGESVGEGRKGGGGILGAEGVLEGGEGGALGRFLRVAGLLECRSSLSDVEGCLFEGGGLPEALGEGTEFLSGLGRQLRGIRPRFHLGCEVLGERLHPGPFGEFCVGWRRDEGEGRRPGDDQHGECNHRQ